MSNVGGFSLLLLLRLQISVWSPSIKDFMSNLNHHISIKLCACNLY